MRYIITLLFSVFFFTQIIGQTIDNLDERNGFKTIKLGSDYSEYVSSELIKVRELSDGVVRYSYFTTNQELTTVFNTKFQNIFLVFKNNKLVGIELRKKFTEPSHYETAYEQLKPIISTFRQLFGQNTSSTVDKPFTLGCIWAGKKVLLQAFTVRIGLKEGSENSIDIYDINFVDKRINSGF